VQADEAVAARGAIVELVPRCDAAVFDVPRKLRDVRGRRERPYRFAHRAEAAAARGFAPGFARAAATSTPTTAAAAAAATAFRSSTRTHARDCSLAARRGTSLGAPLQLCLVLRREAETAAARRWVRAICTDETIRASRSQIWQRRAAIRRVVPRTESDRAQATDGERSSAVQQVIRLVVVHLNRAGGQRGPRRATTRGGRLAEEAERDAWKETPRHRRLTKRRFRERCFGEAPCRSKRGVRLPASSLTVRQQRARVPRVELCQQRLRDCAKHDGLVASVHNRGGKRCGERRQRGGRAVSERGTNAHHYIYGVGHFL